MKILSLTFFSIICLHSGVNAQEYHTPAQIVQIMTDSQVHYDLEPLTKDDIDKSKSEALNQHGVLIAQTSDEQQVLTTYIEMYSQNEQFAQLMIEAEDHFSKESYSAAREIYEQILEMSPKNAQVMTFLGQSYEKEKNYEKAITWYEKAINENFIDYMAHWFLAGLYSRDGKKDAAVQHITIAHLLNRNHPGILEELKSIYKKSGLKYRDWEFNPQYALGTKDNGHISLKVDVKKRDWLIYALCKALWAYEPGYREKMLENIKQSPRFVEELECVTVLLAGQINSGEKPKDKAIQKLIRTIETKQTQEFVLYEILLPEMPEVALQFSKESLEPVINYVKEFRTKK